MFEKSDSFSLTTSDSVVPNHSKEYRIVDMMRPIKYLAKKRISIKLFILFSLWVASFIPVFPGLVGAWFNHGDNSHGILVPFISLFFIWQKRDDLKAAKISSSSLGVFILVASMFLYLLGIASGTEIISRTMIVFSLIGLLFFNLGKEVVKILAFPLLFLVFMIPVL